MHVPDEAEMRWWAALDEPEPREGLFLVRWAHPRGGRLHWRRAGEASALCGTRTAPGETWAPAQPPLDLLRTCPDCDASVRAYVRAALSVSLVLPGVPA